MDVRLAGSLLFLCALAAVTACAPVDDGFAGAGFEGEGEFASGEGEGEFASGEGEGEGEGEPGAPVAPLVRVLRVSLPTALESDIVVVTATVTDANGAADIAGGVLVDDASGGVYGAFNAVPGGYALQLSRADLHRVRPVEFTTEEARTLRARFTDRAGLSAEGTVALTLRCAGGHAACDGVCGAARCDGACVDDAFDDVAHCGDCGSRCAASEQCLLGVVPADNACGCAPGTDACSGACVDLDVDVDHCGACGHACASRVCVDDPFGARGACACVDDGDCAAGERCTFGVCANAPVVDQEGGVLAVHVADATVAFCDLTVATADLVCADFGLGAALGPLLPSGPAPPGTTVFARGLSCTGNAGDFFGCRASFSTAPCVASGVACLANETDAASEVDFCNIQAPLNDVVVAPGSSVEITSQLFQSGLTNAHATQAPGVIAQFGFASTTGAVPPLSAFVFQPAAFRSASPGGNSNNDEYVVTVRKSDGFSGSYRFLFRYSIDGGRSFTYCDEGGAGKSAGQDFNLGNTGVITFQ